MRLAQETLAADDGTALWTCRWEPDASPRASVLLVHGLGEHAGRHAHVACRLADSGYAVQGFDLRGHGRSAGRRGDTRFRAAQDDVEQLLAKAAAAHPGVPRFLYGHSLGALIVLACLVTRRPAVAAAVVSAAPLRNALRLQRAKVLLARSLGRALPWLTLPTGLDARALSRDPAVVAAYRADPLVHGSASLGLARDSLAATAAVETTSSLPVPVLALHGSADRIAFPDGSRALAARLPGTVTLLELPGLFHEPHNEPERQVVLDAVVAWLDARVAQAAPQRPL